MGKSRKKRYAGTLLLITAIVLFAIMAIVFLANGNTTGDITISSNGSRTGIKCVDTRLKHPVLIDYQPLSYINTITAIFSNNALVSIMFRYDGLYQSENEAIDARASAEADYNLILANDYGTDIDVFSHSFMTNGTKMSLTITDNANKIMPRTAPYFLLDTATIIPDTMEKLQATYEAKGFSCTVENLKNDVDK